jgi:hypothetical protein
MSTTREGDIELKKEESQTWAGLRSYRWSNPAKPSPRASPSEISITTSPSRKVQTQDIQPLARASSHLRAPSCCRLPHTAQVLKATLWPPAKRQNMCWPSQHDVEAKRMQLVIWFRKPRTRCCDLGEIWNQTLRSDTSDVAGSG